MELSKSQFIGLWTRRIALEKWTTSNSRVSDNIEIIGASENNLKHIDVMIPKGELVVFAGVSGSGKSSLAFDTVAVESSREWQ